MNNQKHTVTVYVNHETREFSVSRREDNNSHHNEIAVLERSKGFEVNVVFRGLGKDRADAEKVNEINRYLFNGYTQVTRESIPDATVRLGMLPTSAAAQGII